MASEPVSSSVEIRPDLDLLWGCKAIATELGIPPRKVFYLLARGLIPAEKVGRDWVASRHGLRERFAKALSAAAHLNGAGSLTWASAVTKRDTRTSPRDMFALNIG
jgi:hypothetical protein